MKVKRQIYRTHVTEAVSVCLRGFLSPEFRTKYASEKGNLKAITHFKAQVSNLSKSSVRTFKKEYERKLKEKKK